MFGLVADFVEKDLKSSECEKKWKFATLGKRGNSVIRTSLRSTRRVEKPLPHEFKNLPHTLLLRFSLEFFQSHLKKKSRHLPPKFYLRNLNFIYQPSSQSYA